MATDDNTLDDTMFDMSKKKKSKKRNNRNILTEATSITNSTDDTAGDETTNDPTTVENGYSYEYMLSRAFDVIHKTKPPGVEEPNRKFVVPAPLLARVGTTRTSFINFGSIAKALKRQQKHLYEYFLTELGTTASIDSSDALIIRGRFQQRHIETVLRLFIKEYVICKTCHSLETSLEKVDRLTMIKCNICHSHYSVANIRKGFQAQVTKRSRENK